MDHHNSDRVPPPHKIWTLLTSLSVHTKVKCKGDIGMWVDSADLSYRLVEFELITGQHLASGCRWGFILWSFFSLSLSLMRVCLIPSATFCRVLYNPRISKYECVQVKSPSTEANCEGVKNVWARYLWISVSAVFGLASIRSTKTLLFIVNETKNEKMIEGMSSCWNIQFLVGQDRECAAW